MVAFEFLYAALKHGERVQARARTMEIVRPQLERLAQAGDDAIQPQLRVRVEEVLAEGLG